jgi:DNA polymerase III subunit delta
MLILIHGKDAYQARIKVKELLADKNFELIEEPNFLSLKEKLGTGSLFDERKTVLLRDAFSDKIFKEEFLKSVRKLKHKNDLVIFWEDREVLKKEELHFSFDKILNFQPLKGIELKKWVEKYLKKFDFFIDEEALSLLLDCVRDDLWRLSLELEKLTAYCFKTKKIDQKAVSLLVKKSFQTDIFKTLEALVGKDKKTALNFLSSHIEKGESPFYLLSMFYYQFRVLIIVKELEKESLPELIKILKPMSPYAVRKTYEIVKNFEMEGLKKIYSKLFKLDLAVKKGKIAPELALELLIADI